MAKKKKRGKPPTLNKRLELERNKLTAKATSVAVNTLNVIPPYVLSQVFGFGKVRGQRFMREYLRIQQEIIHNNISLDALKDYVKVKMDIDIDTDWEDVLSEI